MCMHLLLGVYASAYIIASVSDDVFEGKSVCEQMPVTASENVFQGKC